MLVFKLMISQRAAEELKKLGYVVKINEEVIGVSGVNHRIPLLVINPKNENKVGVHLDDGSNELILLKLFSIYVDTGIRQLLISKKKSVFKGVEVVNVKNPSELVDIIVDRLESPPQYKNLLTKTY